MVTGLPSMSPLAQLAVAVVVTTVVVQTIRWLLSYRSYFKFYNSLPGETDFRWLWGNLHKIQGQKTAKMLEYFEDLTKKYPKYYRFWMGPFRPVINLNHPDTIKPVLRTSGPKPWIYQQVSPWLGDGLLLAAGPKWARSRRLLTPAFHFDTLKPYVGINNAACDVLLDKMQKYVDKKRSMEIFGLISLCTLDIIMQCAMSYNGGIQEKGESHPYVKAITELTELNGLRAGNPLVHRDFVYYLTQNGKRFKQQCEYAHSLSEHIIKARKEKLEREGPPQKRYLDFLDILLTAKDDSGQGMTSLEIRNEVDTFMFAGHDTTASAISWTLYSLCEHPEYQQKVQREVDHILQGRQSDDILWDDLNKFEFLTLVLKEAMRLHCPVPFVSRVLTEPLKLDGATIPPGNVVRINIQNLHHNLEVWRDPMKFWPERFLAENTEGMDHYAFLPFSAGPRNCIGQHFAMNEEKVVVARLLRKYTFSLDPAHEVEKKMAIVMRAESGMMMYATPRVLSV